jgi:hypothetical protein
MIRVYNLELHHEQYDFSSIILKHFVVMVLIIDVLCVGPLITYNFTFGCVVQVGRH